MNPITTLRRLSSLRRCFSLRRLSSAAGDDWNSAWETAWLPLNDKPTSPTPPDPWTGTSLGIGFQSVSGSPPEPEPEPDTETRAFVEDMNENWDLRRNRNRRRNDEKKESLVSDMMRDYRVVKQRIHAGLWVKEIEKRHEAGLMGDDGLGEGNDIQRLLDSCSEIFDSPNADLDNSKIPSSSELKNKPGGWETTAKAQDGSVWEMSQREEDVLLQEFERRIAFCKFQIASFIKTHIFSRRRPIDGWKYMIEEIGPNARKGKGSVSRIPSLSDEATQPFREERTPIASNAGYIKGR